MNVYVGTTTGRGRAQGIGVFTMNEETGALSHVETVAAENPTFLAVHPSGRYLYAATRPSGGGVGGEPPLGRIEAFAIDRVSKRLSPINSRSSGGQRPAHVGVHPGGACVLVANYGSGHVVALPVAADGSVGEAASVILHQGSSVEARRQDGPHAHFITADPAGERVLACDLGCDKVFVYRVEASRARLEPNDPPCALVSSGAGPRHLTFHPDGRLVFVINELDSTLSSFAYDAERGALAIRDTRSTLPEGYAERSHAAQVVTHPNGRFVYASNRGHDSVAIFGIEEETGKLTPLGHEPTQGKSPRNFNIDPSGELLLAANENSHTIVPFRIDKEEGTLRPTGWVTETPSPTCVQFLAA